jgi:hypothetical protein
MYTYLRRLHELAPTILADLQGPLSDAWHYLYVTYEHPYVRRLWRQYGNERLFLHCLEPVPASEQALWHPHPWPCGTIIVEGAYEMEIAAGGDSAALLRSVYAHGSYYEMTQPEAWHVVRPIVPTWSVMLVGPLYEQAAVFPKPHNPGERLSLDDARVQDYAARWASLGAELRSQLDRLL